MREILSLRVRYGPDFLAAVVLPGPSLISAYWGIPADCPQDDPKGWARPRAWRFFVSARPADGGVWKNLFHVTFPEVFFESNGELYGFVAEQLRSQADMSSSSSHLARPFHVDTAKDFYDYEQNSKIAGLYRGNVGVLSKPSLEAPGSHKPGEAACTVASRHISTHDAEVSDPRRACEAKRPARMKLSPAARDWVCNRLEAMLRAAGDPDSEVSVHSDPDLQQDNIIYRGKNGPQGRVCLVQKARGKQCVHRHKHFFLIYDVQVAWYFCHSSQCRKTEPNDPQGSAGAAAPAGPELPVAPRQKPRDKGAQLVPRQESRRKRLKRVQEATDQSESESESPGRESKCAASDEAGQSESPSPDSRLQRGGARERDRRCYSRGGIRRACYPSQEAGPLYSGPLYSLVQPLQIVIVDDKNERRDLTSLPTSQDFQLVETDQQRARHLGVPTFQLIRFLAAIQQLAARGPASVAQSRGRGLRMLLGPRITFNLGLCGGASRMHWKLLASLFNFIKTSERAKTPTVLFTNRNLCTTSPMRASMMCCLSTRAKSLHLRPMLSQRPPRNTVLNVHRAHMLRFVYIHRSTDSISWSLHDTLDRGYRVAICCGTKRRAKQLEAKLRLEHPGIRVRTYHRHDKKTDPNEAMKDFLLPTEHWNRCGPTRYCACTTPASFVKAVREARLGLVTQSSWRIKPEISKLLDVQTAIFRDLNQALKVCRTLLKAAAALDIAPDKGLSAAQD
eukprot:g78561.t1